MPNTKIMLPSKIWEDRLGIKISKDWGLTNNQELQDTLLADPLRFSTETPFVTELYDKLTKSYPTLLTIPLVKTIDKYHVVFGCISQFNLYDIEYFVTRIGDFDPLLDARQTALNAKIFPENFQWRMSKWTIKRVEKALNIVKE